MIKDFALWAQEYPDMILSHKMSTKFVLFRSKQTILEGLHHGAVELSCARMMVGGSTIYSVDVFGHLSHIQLWFEVYMIHFW